MSQSSLEEQLKEAGIPVKRGVKIVHSEPGASMREIASNIWLLRWAKNSYLNYHLAEKNAGIVPLVDSCKGLPSIIVGVGPSLDDCIADLKKAQGRAIIIAVDAAFRSLMANGIRPDLVLTYDCKAEQSLLWADVPKHNVPLLADICAHPDTIASWQGPVALFRHFHQADEFSKTILPHIFPNLGQIPSGGTVGNSALLLTKILGCSPALAVGMDFCYKNVGEGEVWKYRARDYRYDAEIDQWLATEIKTLYDNDERFARSALTTIKGEVFRMDPELQFYHETFATFVSHFKIETINCSPDGALRQVCATLPLRDAIERFCPREFVSPIGGKL